jgi:hypothetical protein
MRRHRKRQALIAAVGAAALVGLGVGAGPSGLVAQAATRHLADLSSSASVTVVASGLNGPRNLIWGPDGHLLVSEAGTPPTTCVGTQCFGLNGSISDISSGTPTRIVTGLATYSDKGYVVGVDGLAYVHHHLYTLVTHTPLASVPSGIPADLTAELTRQFGALLDLTGGKISVVTNPGDVDYQWALEHESLAPHDFPDSNPYDLVPKPGGGFYLVDAASDTLDSIDRWGHVRVLAFIPNTPAGTDSVPTCLARGPGGAVYVGELTGYGNSATAANVYRYTPWNGSLTVWQSGFSAINGCGFGANGDFYVTEFDTTGLLPTSTLAGAVIQISHDGTRTVLGDGQLTGPGGFLAGRDGSIYVVNNQLSTGTGAQTGEVVRIG